jgi:hypothetical protein
LVTYNVPVLTDLDGMRVHKWNWTYKIRQTKDWERFLFKIYLLLYPNIQEDKI